MCVFTGSLNSSILGIARKTEMVTNFYGEMRCRTFPGWLDKLTVLPKIEYMIVSFDNSTKNAMLSLRQTEILAKLNATVDEPCEESLKL